MDRFLSPEKQYELISSGVVDCVNKEEFLEKLRENRPLRIKAGFDPSRPDIHLGHLLLIGKLRQFQDLGHKVFFVVGDWTACIGDPSGQNKTRPLLSKEEAEGNAKTYILQATRKNFPLPETFTEPRELTLYASLKRLDSQKTEFVHNSQWLDKLSLREFVGRMASCLTLARTLERNDFSERYKEGKPIGLHEFLYPLLQAYDSVELKADVEIGGTDQLFNLLLGRDLQKDFGQTPQCILTLPLLEGLDGFQKMSKSLNNTVSFQDSPDSIFGKIMSLSDELMIRYWEKLGGVDESYKLSIKNKTLHPKEEKERLAHGIVLSFHGDAAAEESKDRFRKVFSERKLPDRIPEKTFKAFSGLWICRFVKELGLVSSTSEARRLIEGGGLQWDGKKRLNSKEKVDLISGQSFILRAGRKKFLKVQVL